MDFSHHVSGLIVREILSCTVSCMCVCASVEVCKCTSILDLSGILELDLNQEEQSLHCVMYLNCGFVFLVKFSFFFPVF